MDKKLNNSLLFFPPCRVHPIDADGNCQWKSLSWACFGTPKYHQKIRNRVCIEIETNWSHYGDFIVDEAKENYVRHMSKAGSWGDHCTLAAFCNVYHQFVLLMDFDNPPVMVKPRQEKKKVKASEWLVITYDNSKMHYSSVDPYYSSPTSKFLRRISSEE